MSVMTSCLKVWINKMGLYDRDYSQDGYRAAHRFSPSRIGFPSLTPIVKILLIINCVVFALQLLGGDRLLTDWFAVWPRTISMGLLQVWRYVTYQFLHDTRGLRHIFFNMLALYMFGTMLERHWGRERFLVFYLTCGVVGGLTYPFLLLVNVLNPPAVAQLIGASGSILGILAACAMLFPRMNVYIWGILPVRIWVLALVFALGAFLTIQREGPNAGGEAAHLGGLAAGALFVLFQGRGEQFVSQVQKGRWERKMVAEKNLEAQVDQILHKVQESGIHSLTHAERAILKRATEAEQRRSK
jgi:membrane associated rhomboid family serine protease